MNPTSKDIRRFMEKVCGSEDRCQIWIASCFPNGYGQFKLNGQNLYAHRLAYRIAYGTFDLSLDVLHTCDNPPCCNPLHLFLGDQSTNMQDMSSKGRSNLGRRISGSKHLSDTEVDSLRVDWDTGNFTQGELAYRYNLSRPHVCKIINNRERVF